MSRRVRLSEANSPTAPTAHNERLGGRPLSISGCLRPLDDSVQSGRPPHCSLWAMVGLERWPLSHVSIHTTVGHREKTRGNRQLCGVGVGPTKGLSEKSLNRSLSSIHIHYNHTLTRALSSPPGRRTGLIIFNQPEVVHVRERRDGIRVTES